MDTIILTTWEWYWIKETSDDAWYPSRYGESGWIKDQYGNVPQPIAISGPIPSPEKE